jgi:hypothetical protein
MALRSSVRQPTSGVPSKERDDLYEEFKQKSALLASVQRNYEAISRLMQEKTKEMAKVFTSRIHICGVTQPTQMNTLRCSRQCLCGSRHSATARGGAQLCDCAKPKWLHGIRR